jgi:hypothetical protein
MIIINIIKKIYYFIINIFNKNNDKCNIVETARIEKPDGSTVVYFKIE